MLKVSDGVWYLDHDFDMLRGLARIFPEIFIGQRLRKYVVSGSGLGGWVCSGGVS